MTILGHTLSKSVLIAIVGVCAVVLLASNPSPSTNNQELVMPSVAAQDVEQDTIPLAAQKVEDGTVLVTRVVDGDTIELENGQRVRYIGIDTPETVDPRKAVQCFGEEASKRNKQLMEGQRVRLEKDVSETDKYGRLLRYVYTGDMMVNLELVEQGFAHSSTYPPDVKYQDRLVEAERKAREAKRGLWGACSTTITKPIDVTPVPILPTTASPATTQGNGTSVVPVPISDQSSSCVIKGNISSGGKIYHLPGCGSYNKTKISEAQGEYWFCTEEEAIAAGWRKALNCP